MTMKRVFLLVASGLLLLLAIMSLFIWPLDLFSSKKRVLATYESSDGSHISVLQWWNRTDFYSVELSHTAPNGLTRTCLIDADAGKWWSCDISNGPVNRKLAILHRGKFEGSYDFGTGVFTRANGLAVPLE